MSVFAAEPTLAARAVAYCRISSDPTGRALGVDRQQSDCAALVADRGWDLARTYVDNDLSAYSGKPRPGYRALLDAVRAGEVNAVVAWHPDRLHRSPAELEEFIELVERHGVRIETVQAGEWDLSTPSGRLVARQIGAVSRYESEHKSARVRRALEQRAEMGRPHGRKAYGWSRDFAPETGQSRETIEPAEADVVRAVAAALVRGESLRSITAGLNDRGVPSPAGKVWGKNMVRHLVTRERNVGLRVHQGEVVGEGDWPRILERGQWDQVRAILSDPSRRTSVSSAAAHLLSGIALCGVCGATMRAGSNRSVPSYRCSVRSCVSRRRDLVDDLVERVVLGRLAMPDAARLMRSANSPVDDRIAAAANEAQELRSRLDLAADEYADGAIDGRQMTRITERLRPRIEAAERIARQVNTAPLLEGVAGRPDVAMVWRELPLSRRRAIVALLVEVRVLRTTAGARVFDPESIEISWKGATR